MNQIDNFLDLKSTPCPLNVVKCKLALEKLSNENVLFVELDKGEPEIMVKESIINMGYIVEVINEGKDWVRLSITNENI